MHCAGHARGGLAFVKPLPAPGKTPATGQRSVASVPVRPIRQQDPTDSGLVLNFYLSWLTLVAGMPRASVRSLRFLERQKSAVSVQEGSEHEGYERLNRLGFAIGLTIAHGLLFQR